MLNARCARTRWVLQLLLGSRSASKMDGVSRSRRRFQSWSWPSIITLVFSSLWWLIHFFHLGDGCFFSRTELRSDYWVLSSWPRGDGNRPPSNWLCWKLLKINMQSLTLEKWDPVNLLRHIPWRRRVTRQRCREANEMFCSQCSFMFLIYLFSFCFFILLAFLLLLIVAFILALHLGEITVGEEKFTSHTSAERSGLGSISWKHEMGMSSRPYSQIH